LSLDEENNSLLRDEFFYEQVKHCVNMSCRYRFCLQHQLATKSRYDQELLMRTGEL